MTIPVAILIAIRNVNKLSCELWMQERVEEGPLNGLLEFPGGKIESGETPTQAALREFEEEAKVLAGRAKLFKIKSFDYSDRNVCLFVHFSAAKNLNPVGGSWFEFTFEKKSFTYKGRLPEVNYEIIDDLLRYIKKHVDAGLVESIWAQRS